MAVILHTIETGGPGGAENTLLNLLDGGRSRGHEGVVVLRKDGWLAEQVRQRGVSCHIVPFQRRVDFAWLRSVAGLVEKEQVAALHAHEFGAVAHCALLSRRLGLPAVLTLHGRKYFSETLPRRIALRRAARWGRLVAVSTDIKQILVDDVGITPDRVTVIANGIPVARFNPESARRRRTREALGIPPDAFLLGAIGNLYEVKGHRFLVDAVARLAPAYPHLMLAVAGRGGEEGRLREQIEAAGLQRQVRLLGFREDVDDLLQAFDAFVMSSLSEGTPLSILEAMAAAKPVIATDVGGIAAALGSSAGKALCPPGDATALAAAIESVVQDTGLRSHMAAAGRARAEQEFDLDVMLNRYLPLYGCGA